jgi:hypothetical protein
MNGTDFSTAIANQFLKLGALRAELTAGGIVTHWQTEFEAAVAQDKFKEMKLCNVERFREKNGVHVVCGMFPK